MMRGGGGGAAAGGQLLELISVLASSRRDALLMALIGLVLMILIIRQMINVKAAPYVSQNRSALCLLCSSRLTEQDSYVDRYFPNWIICGTCYAGLSPPRQRQYRPDKAASSGSPRHPVAAPD